MKKVFISSLILVFALVSGISYGYLSNKKIDHSNSSVQKICSNLDSKASNSHSIKNNIVKTTDNLNNNQNSKKNLVKAYKETDNKTDCDNNKKCDLSKEDRQIIKKAESYENVNNNSDIVTEIGEKKIVDGTEYYHIHMVSKQLINNGGSGTVDDFYINKDGKVIKNFENDKSDQVNNEKIDIKNKITKLAEKYEGVDNNSGVITEILASKKIDGVTYYKIHMLSKFLMKNGGSGTIDNFYIDLAGNVLK